MNLWEHELSSVVDVEHKKPTVDSVTIKLTREEARLLVDAYQDVFKREPYFFSLWGRMPGLVQQVQDALDGTVTIPKAQKPMSSPFFGDLIMKAYGASAT